MQIFKFIVPVFIVVAVVFTWSLIIGSAGRREAIDAPEAQHHVTFVDASTPLVSISCGDKPCFVTLNKETKSFVVQYFSGDTWTISQNNED